MALKMPVAKHGFVTPCGTTIKDVSAFDLLVCRIAVRLFSSSPEFLLIRVIHTYSGGKIPGVRANKFVRWRLIYVGPQYRLCSVSPVWCAEF
jgi:hypothetical protein